MKRAFGWMVGVLLLMAMFLPAQASNSGYQLPEEILSIFSTEAWHAAA